MIGINITWQWHHNSFSFKSNFSPHRPELWKCFTLRILWVLVIRYAQFYRNLCEQFRDIFEFLQNGLKLCTNWRLEFANFRMIKEKVLSLTHYANDPFTFYNQLNASRLAQIQKRRKRVNLGKMQCRALFVIFKATFTKTAIKPKFDDRFSLKISVIQCTIKCPIFMFIVTFLSCLT